MYIYQQYRTRRWRKMAEVSKIEVVVMHGWQSEPTDGPKCGWGMLRLWVSLYLSVSLALALSLSLSLSLSFFHSLTPSLSVSICLPVYLLSDNIYLSIYLSFYLSLSLFLSLSLPLSLSLSLSLCIYVYMFACMYLCMHVWHMCIYVCIWVPMYACMHVCIHVSLCCLSCCLSVCLAVWLSGCLAVWLAVCLSLCLDKYAKYKLLDQFLISSTNRDFLQKWRLKGPKRSNSVRAFSKNGNSQQQKTKKTELATSKTKQFCEASFKNGEFAELTASCQFVLWFCCPCVSSTAPATKKWGQAIRSAAPVHAKSSQWTWRSDAPRCKPSQEIRGLTSQHATRHASLQILLKRPMRAIVFRKCRKKTLTFGPFLWKCKIHCACQDKFCSNVQKCSKHAVFSVLTSKWLNVLGAVATAVCILSTALSSTSKSAPTLVCLQHFDLEMCLDAHPARWLRTGRFSKSTSRPSIRNRKTLEKETVFRDFSTFWRTLIFVLLTLSLTLPTTVVASVHRSFGGVNYPYLYHHSGDIAVRPLLHVLNLKNMEKSQYQSFSLC